jgi:hypothetical protein
LENGLPEFSVFVRHRIINPDPSSQRVIPIQHRRNGKIAFTSDRDGLWYLLQSIGGVSIRHFGFANDEPIQSAYLP